MRCFLLLLAFAESLSAQTHLSIQRSNDQVVLRWPVTAIPFRLQANESLNSSAGWASLANNPAVIGGTNVVVLSITASNQFFRLRADCDPASPDLPDQDFADTNCDGIDGDIARAIFVSISGNDGFPGTMSQPVRTVAEAIQRAAAAGKDVYVSAGVYQSSTLNLSNGVSVYGGYDPNNWSRSDALTAALTITNPVAVNAFDLATNTILDRLTITGGDALGFGASAYGIFAHNSPGLLVRRTSIQSGDAGDAVAGVSGINGSNGGNGGNGTPGCEDSSGFCSGCNRPPGGLGGTSACGRTGGLGGLPGHGGGGGSPGGMGVGGTPGGPGAPCGGSRGCNGAPGADGAPGFPGSHGLPAALGTYSASGYVRDTSGRLGLPGGNGNGGGGGGGGGGGDNDCDSYGSSGGGGGAGGCGGVPGAGGQSGGGSFAIYLWNSSARIEHSTLITGDGAAGGNGGTGGFGGTGGAPGFGGAYGGAGEQDDGGDGAPGGRGGDGGRGGHGGGGAGGPSIGIVRAGGSAPQLMSLTFVLGSGGPGGFSAGNSGPDGPALETY